MIVRLICVGKVKERFTQEWLREFEKRLTKYCAFEVVELKETSKDKEAGEILRLIKSDDVIVLFDVGGKTFSSSEFAELLRKQTAKRVVLVIGGPDGVTDEVRKRANHLISISRMTFTHQIARLLVTEQLYRAFTIIRGERYHK
jgi:23S rRNA (pseudouridine1915-N3)-methyltransferase